MQGRTIFREAAIEAYRRGSEKDVVPRLVSRPASVCRSLLLAVLLASVALSWWVRIPSYLDASGVIVLQRGAGSGGAETVAVVFVPPGRAPLVRPGRPVRLELRPSATDAQGTVEQVKPGVVGPDTVRERYGLGADVVAQPSSVVVVRLEGTPQGAEDGTGVSAQVETGSERLIMFLVKPSSRSAG